MSKHIPGPHALYAPKSFARRLPGRLSCEPGSKLDDSELTLKYADRVKQARANIAVAPSCVARTPMVTTRCRI